METPRIHLGTSSFTAAGWAGSFYPKGLKHSEYLAFYSDHFNTVEIDSTFYACPSPSTVKGWAHKTPDDFIFAVKVPQTITHEKVLVDCDEEFNQFVQTMSILDRKLGPMVLQFPYFNSDLFQTPVQFLSRLRAFPKKTPTGYKLAVEIRNSTGWMTVWVICCESTRLLSCSKTGNGCRCRTNSQKLSTPSRPTGRIYAGLVTGKALSKLRGRGTEQWLTAQANYPAGLIIASRFSDAGSPFSLTLTIISPGMLPQRFDNSASCGLRKDCPR